MHEIVSQLILDTKGASSALGFSADSSLGAFLPELVLCLTIVAMLLVRVCNLGGRIDSFWIALAGAGVALLAAAPWSTLATGEQVPRM